MSLLYDGVYYCKGWEENQFFRFYPDGTFVTKNIFNYETDDRNEIYFPDVENTTREPRENYRYSGTYRIKRNTVSFILKFQTGTISYWGKIEENRLILNYYRKLQNDRFKQSGTEEFPFRADTTEHLRFDGVYRFWRPYDCNDLFRFYPDGTVIRASFGCGFGESGETVPTVAKRWCTKERNQNQGKYQLQGRILKDALLIDSHSRINQIEHIGEQYEFVPD